MGMSVSMDGLRRQMARSYNSLVYQLNNSIEDGEKIEIEIDRIQGSLDNIRGCIGTLLAMYQEGEFDVMDEDLEIFNPEEDEENEG